MTESVSGSRLTSLRRHLLLWFGGCAIAMVVAYTQLLEYYLDQGIALRTQSFLERVAQSYERSWGGNAELPNPPAGRNYVGYRDLGAIPFEVSRVFPLENLRDGQVERFSNLSFDDEHTRRYALETGELCPEGVCELLFLYPYQLADASWLYLLHGLVGSDMAYAELEFAEQVAFAIGTAFAILLLLVSLILFRNIDRPLQLLNRWSASQAANSSDLQLPNLRFHEFDTLARRLGSAFRGLREGIRNEERFLRHASHELRTPLSVLSANLELLDRLYGDAPRTGPQKAAFARQYQALDEITLLTETLLWVHRQSEDPPTPESIDLRTEVAALIEQHRHLLADKAMSIEINGIGDAFVPQAAAHILLSNLVRNALQHSSEGTITFKIADDCVQITNSLLPATSAGNTTNHSFGMGLELVELLCKRLDWECSTQESSAGRTTQVRFAGEAADR